MSKGRSP